MTKDQCIEKMAAFRRLVLAKYPNLTAYDPQCSGRPFVPDGSAQIDKARYILFTLDRLENDRKAMQMQVPQDNWVARAYRQLRFVEGLLWGSDITPLGEIIDLDQKICELDESVMSALRKGFHGSA